MNIKDAIAYAAARDIKVRRPYTNKFLVGDKVVQHDSGGSACWYVVGDTYTSGFHVGERITNTMGNAVVRAVQLQVET